MSEKQGLALSGKNTQTFSYSAYISSYQGRKDFEH